MFVPDDADLRSFKELSPTAGALYRFYCRWRDHETGYSWKKFEHAREALALTRATAYRSQKELLDGFWIFETGEGRVGLGGGSFAPVDKTEQATRVWMLLRDQLAESKRLENGGKASLKIETAPIEESQNRDSNLNFETENPKIETNRLKIETAPYIDRARVSSSSSSILSSTHTHSSTAQPAAREGPAEERVCVCRLPHGSEFCDGVRLAYARNQPEIINPTGYAQSAPVRAGRDDQLIREWQAKVERPAGTPELDASACPDCHGNGMYYPTGYEKGAAKCKHLRLGQTGTEAATASDKFPAELEELCATVEALVQGQGRSPDEVIAEMPLSTANREMLLARYRAGPSGTARFQAAGKTWTKLDGRSVKEIE
jgi:hypothetical protein